MDEPPQGIDDNESLLIYIGALLGHFDEVRALAVADPVMLEESDAKSDFDALPGWNLPFLALDLLGTVVDHLQMFRAALNSGQKDVMQWHARAPWTLLRAALESSSQAIWLLQPDDQKTRIARHLRLLLQDEKDSHKAERLTYRLKDQGHFPSLQANLSADFIQAANLFGVDLDSANLEILKLVREAAKDAKFVPADHAELLWRIASGFAHGRPWASRVAGRSRSAEPAGASPMTQSAIDLPIVAQLLSLCVVTLEYAVAIFRRRLGNTFDFELFVTAAVPHQRRLSALGRTD